MADGRCWKATSHSTWSHHSLAGRTKVTTETLLSQFLLYFLDKVTEEEEELIHNKSTVLTGFPEGLGGCCT